MKNAEIMLEVRGGVTSTPTLTHYITKRSTWRASNLPFSFLWDVPYCSMGRHNGPINGCPPSWNARGSSRNPRAQAYSTNERAIELKKNASTCTKVAAKCVVKIIKEVECSKWLKRRLPKERLPQAIRDMRANKREMAETKEKEVHGDEAWSRAWALLYSKSYSSR
jgi:hypothetical protein